jgi:hypothetical protein
VLGDPDLGMLRVVRGRLPLLTLVLAVVAAGVAGLVIVLAVLDGGEEPIDPLGATAPPPFRDMSPDALESRAADGLAHVLYEKSPGGPVATAERTARWRGQVESVAGQSGSDPDLLEAIVFLESAGRSDAVAGPDVASAAGLTQILPGTATDFLGMEVDLEASRRLSSRLRRAQQRRENALARRLSAERRRIDERFDPQKALEGTGRYLRTARERFGREELAVVSYHMGIGNLEQVLRAYAGPEADGDIGDLVEDLDLDYARVFFESGPDRHGEAWKVLTRLGDDSSTYLWRVLAARRIMRLWRRAQARLGRLAELQSAKASAEEVLHPESETEVFDDPEDLQAAYAARDIRPFPDDPTRFGVRVDPRMGSLAARLDRPRTFYRGLRPEALALAAWMGRRVRELSGADEPLSVTSTVRDRSYQRLLAGRTREATHGYSLHTTGYSLDVLRSYPGEGQAAAFQFMLDRLQALNLIAWVREPEVIHLTVSPEARAFR